MRLFLVRVLSWGAPVALYAVNPLLGIGGLVASVAVLAAWRARTVTA